VLPVRRFNRILAAATALGLLLVATGSAAAAPPTKDPIASAAKGGGHGGGGGGGGGGGQGGTTPHGYDISYPQCGAPYPSNPAFAIVGVNGGRPYVAGNPCLTSQLTWGGRENAGLYINTANPNPSQSSFWPTGKTEPRYCDPAATSSADCSYDYGWYAAADSYAKARAAYSSLGITVSPSATSWWLDVETTNSWQTNTANNVAMLQGEVDYLRSVGATKLGFYSTTVQWGTITGGSKVFSPMPVWGAGSSSETAALSLCRSTTTSFTGGPLSIVQYIASGFDVDIRC
jgi:hypothetical protein